MNKEDFMNRVQHEIATIAFESKYRCDTKCNDNIFKQNFSSNDECLIHCSTIDISGWKEARKFFFDMGTARR